MKENMSLLNEGLKDLNLDQISEDKLDQFQQYLELLQKWNKKINLTAIDEAREITIKHFIDSLSCFKLLDLKKEDKIIDVGTGAGFPTVPLKIVKPDFDLVLLEAVEKKLFFLQELCYKLGLEGIEFIHGRAENFGRQKKYRANFDWVLARAVAELNILTEYTFPFVKVGGNLIVQKGKQAEREVDSAREAIKLLGGEIIDIIDFKLPYTDAVRYLIKIKKISPTPENYPRRIGVPEKKPL